MTEHMTIDEIKSQFVDQWVLINDPQTNNGSTVIGGQVVFHDHNPDKVYQMISELMLSRTAVIFTGEAPKYELVNIGFHGPNA